MSIATILPQRSQGMILLSITSLASGGRGLPFFVLNLIPLQRELGLVEAKLMARPVLRFSSGHRGRRPL
jgi:hypothetical protein